MHIIAILLKACNGNAVFPDVVHLREKNYRIMKIKYLFMAFAAVALASCGSSKTAKIADLDGAWDIVSIEGNDVAGSDPFIGFDAASGNIFGSAGCNRLLGSFDVDAKPGSLSLGRMGTTRMMCADMATEDRLLQAFTKVAGYKSAGKNRFALTDGNNNTVIELQRRYAKTPAEKLDAEFKIVAIRGEAVPDDLADQPFVSFNTREKRFNGNDSCNLFGGSCEIKGSAISLSPEVSTMKACPHLGDFEGKVLEAINHVAKFGTLPNGNIGLLDDGDTIVLELQKR